MQVHCQIDSNLEKLILAQRKKLIQSFLNVLESISEAVGYIKRGDEDRFITNSFNKFCNQANNSNLLVSSLQDEAEEEIEKFTIELHEDLKKFCLSFSEHLAKIKPFIPKLLDSPFKFYYETLRKPTDCKYKKTNLIKTGNKNLINMPKINLELLTNKINDFLFAYSNSDSELEINIQSKDVLIEEKIEKIINERNLVPEKDINGIIQDNLLFFHKNYDKSIMQNFDKIMEWNEKKMLSEISRTQLIEHSKYLVGCYKRGRYISYENIMKKYSKNLIANDFR